MNQPRDVARDLGASLRSWRARIGVRRLVDRLSDTSIAVYDPAWTMLAHNYLWIALTGESVSGDHRAPNLVWRAFAGRPGGVRRPRPAEYRPYSSPTCRTSRPAVRQIGTWLP
jgi:hypothetical protein